MENSNVLPKITQLNKTADYIHWKRRIHAFLRRDDPQLVGLTENPGGSQQTQKIWLEKSTRAKSNIILCLGADALSQTRTFIDDDDRTAKELWEELERIYTTTSAQAIQNLHQRLDALVYDEKKDWNDHISTFLSICGELATYDAELSDADKVSKLIRSLPPSFSALAMVSHLTSTSFDNVKIAVAAELERRANPHNPHSENKEPKTDKQSHAVMFGRGRTRARKYRGSSRGRGAGRGGRNQDIRTCHYCGKPGHFISVCRIKREDENSGRIHRPSRGRYTRGGYNTRGGDYRDRFEYEDNSGPANWRGNTQYREHYPSDHGQNPPQTNYADMPTRGQASAMYRVPDDKPPPFDQAGSRYRASVVKFRTTVATIGDKKSSEALIDSGGTHHFFHSKSSFLDCEPISEESVLAAFGSTTIIGKGLVWIPLNGGMQVEAYHAPRFSNNILAVCHLAVHYDVLFTSTFRSYSGNRCFILETQTKRVIFQTPCENGLYSMPTEAQNRMAALVAHAPKLGSNIEALDWHNKVGHPSSQRYIQLSNMREDVPTFHSNTLKNIDCVPCLKGKARRAPVRPVPATTIHALEEIHLDISGPFVPTIFGEKYAVHFMDGHTAKSDVRLLKARSELGRALTTYKSYAETFFSPLGFRVKRIRLDQAGENMSNLVRTFCAEEGISLQPAPPHAPQSDGTAERLGQEHWTRTRVLMFSSQLPNPLWGEGIMHANWLRNRLPSSRIKGNLPILAWDPAARIDFANLLQFGQPGFAFIYRSPTVARKKLLPRSEYGHFVGVQGNERLIRVFIPAEQTIRVLRRVDFRPVGQEKLPSILSLLDGLARQDSIEVSENVHENENAEANLVQCMAAIHEAQPNLAYPVVDPDDTPRSFNEACNNPDWADAIDREFDALIRRRTWILVPRARSMNVIRHKWVFRKKVIDAEGRQFLCKARCVARGDQQEAGLDFNPETLYAPVAAHESIRLILAFAASTNLILEGGDISNAYLYGNLDVPIYMDQPTNSSRCIQKPYHVCQLLKAMYGAKQAANIWGSVLHDSLISWKFTVSNFDARVYFLKHADSFIIIAIVVDDMAFATNARDMLENLKTKLRAKFDVKLFGQLSSFIGWSITRSDLGMKVTQTPYIERLMQKYGLSEAKHVLTPLPTNADLLPASPHERLLCAKDHATYRAVVGGLLYVAVCTRPDLSFAIGVLARQLHAPTERHFKLLKRTLRYLKGTSTIGLNFPINGMCAADSICAAVDADWGGDEETRRPTSGYVVTVYGSPIFWRSKRQTVIALSSAESEYVALSACAKDVKWLRQLFWEICNQQPWRDEVKFVPTIIGIDSTAAISLATNQQVSARNKHISLKVHHVRELLARGVVQLRYVPSAENAADMLTKIMSLRTLSNMKSILKME